MNLENQTPFAARVLRLEREEGQVQAVIVVKATFEPDGAHRGGAGAGLGLGAVGAGIRWIPAAEQVPIVDDRLDTPFGVFHTDCFARKEGVDVCVLGTVRPPRPAKTVGLRLEVAGHTAALSVFGDRRWVRSGTGLAASSPLPFDQMPLSYSRAYGGVTEHDYETMTWSDNPLGCGYYLSAQRAESQPLPNIEPGGGSPLIRDWADQPTAAGWAPYPMFWGVRAREGVVPPQNPGSGELPRLKPRLNNNAHPAMILGGDLPAGAEVRIRGMQGTEMVFPLPQVSLAAEISVGQQTTTAAQGRIDGVFLWIDAGRITLTQRIPFAYTYQKGEVRQARLLVARGD